MAGNSRQISLDSIDLDPADALPVRPVGAWSARKYFFLDRYMDIFATGMRHKFNRRVYIDLFAGPGRCIDQTSRTLLDGSALLALRHPFTDHIYVELDPASASALEQRVGRPPGRDVTVIRGDCNVVIDEVIAKIPRYALVFAFVDPTNWQVRFDTIRRLAQDRRVDLLVSFFAGSMKRVAHLPDQPRVDAFFDTPAWRTDQAYLGPGGLPSLSGLMECYRRQLVSIGYVDHPARRELPVKNSRNATMYLLAYFAKHGRGYEFWDKITADDESGQVTIPWT